MSAEIPTIPDGREVALPPQPIQRDLVKEIAMDIGKEVASYIEIMFPEAVSAASSTFLLSLRNSIHNQIVEAISHNDPNEIRRWLDERKVSAPQVAGAVEEAEERHVLPRHAGRRT